MEFNKKLTQGLDTAPTHWTTLPMSFKNNAASKEEKQLTIDKNRIYQIYLND